ncbi:unnamed protein product [Heligmosomoides polygyrus]|uniref:DUF3006 domain-containing protein n=1 Tax=Heligmosomoides polygyrus TaxID=6339 RepID=A0A183GIF7_HELPZ|nr:unnamed protein product [Heligmosomoides polygyrus]
MLWGDCFIWHDLRVCDENSVAVFHKDEIYPRLGVPTIERGEVGVALTKHSVHYGEVVRIRILKDTLTICISDP